MQAPYRQYATTIPYHCLVGRMAGRSLSHFPLFSYWVLSLATTFQSPSIPACKIHLSTATVGAALSAGVRARVGRQCGDDGVPLQCALGPASRRGGPSPVERDTRRAPLGPREWSGRAALSLRGSLFTFAPRRAQQGGVPPPHSPDSRVPKWIFITLISTTRKR